MNTIPGFAAIYKHAPPFLELLFVLMALSPHARDSYTKLQIHRTPCLVHRNSARGFRGRALHRVQMQRHQDLDPPGAGGVQATVLVVAQNRRAAEKRRLLSVFAKHPASHNALTQHASSKQLLKPTD